MATNTPDLSRLHPFFQQKISEVAARGAELSFGIMATELTVASATPELDVSQFPSIKIGIPRIDREAVAEVRKQIYQILGQFRNLVEPKPETGNVRLLALASRALKQVFQHVDSASQALFEGETPDFEIARKHFERAQVIFNSIGFPKGHYLGLMLDAAMRGITSEERSKVVFTLNDRSNT